MRGAGPIPALLVLITVQAGAQAPGPVWAPGAEVTQWGLYCLPEPAEVTPAPGMVDGEMHRHPHGAARHVRTQAAIPAREGLAFGYRYRMEAPRRAGSEMAMLMDGPGGPIRDAWTHRTDTGAGREYGHYYTFPPGAPIGTGPRTLVTTGPDGELIAGVRFVVVPDDGSLPDPCGAEPMS